jgi:hypothetical protein
MHANRLLGIIPLVVGVVLLVIGVNASNSVVDQVSNTFTGRFTHATIGYILSGIALTLLGVLMVLFSGRRSNV